MKHRRVAFALPARVFCRHKQMLDQLDEGSCRGACSLDRYVFRGAGKPVARGFPTLDVRGVRSRCSTVATSQKVIRMPACPEPVPCGPPTPHVAHRPPHPFEASASYRSKPRPSGQNTRNDFLKGYFFLWHYELVCSIFTVMRRERRAPSQSQSISRPA